MLEEGGDMVSIPAEGHHGMDSIPLLAARHYAGLVLSQFIALSLVGLLGNPLFVVILVSRMVLFLWGITCWVNKPGRASIGHGF